MLSPLRVAARRRIALLALALAVPCVAQAQSATDTTAGAAGWGDSVAVWASVGLGPARGAGESQVLFAGVARGTVSVGRWLVTYRASDAGPFLGSGNGVEEAAVLTGMRTGGHRVFASGVVGYSRAKPYQDGGIDGGGRRTYAPSESALAYDVSLHGNVYVPGVALSLSGDIGSSRSTYTALTLSVELGWFGR